MAVRAVLVVPTGRARLSTVRIVDLHVLRRIAERSAGAREAVITIQVAHLRTNLPRPPSGRDVATA